MYDIFQTRKINYSLRSQTDFASICVNTKTFDLNSLRYFASKVWSMVPIELKVLEVSILFKRKIRNWEPEDCYCYQYKTYVNNLGFVNVIDTIYSKKNVFFYYNFFFHCFFIYIYSID